MSANNLTGTSPAATLNQLLHIGTATLSAGAAVRLGDGSATVLSLSTTGIQVAGTLATDGLAIGRLGTTARSVKITDASGALHPVQRAGGVGDFD